MTELNPDGRFGRQLLRWLLAGAVTAIPSAIWAKGGRYEQLPEVLGEITAIIICSTAFAVVCSLPCMQSTRTRRRWAAAVWQSVWWRIGAVALGLVGTVACHAIRLSVIAVPFELAVGFDLLTGSQAVRSVEAIGRLLGTDASARADSYGWTLVTAMLQGVALSLELVAISWLLVRRPASDDESTAKEDSSP